MAASSIGSPSFVTERDDGSSVIAPTVDRGAACGRGPAASLDRADASDELSGGERLHDVVVRSELEPDDPVDLFAAGGEHHDRHVGARADLPAEVAAVPVRKHHVEEHHVRFVATERLACGRERARDLGREPVAGEVGGRGVRRSTSRPRPPARAASCVRW